MVRVSCVVASCVLVVLVLAVPSSAYPSPSNYYRDEGPYSPEEIMDILNRLGNFIQLERKMENYKDDITSEKRGLDLGLSRGYSGTLQAKHLMESQPPTTPAAPEGGDETPITKLIYPYIL